MSRQTSRIIHEKLGIPPGARNLYAVLGVSEDVPSSEIPKAFMREWQKLDPHLHPEPGKDAVAKELQTARDILKDPEKRALYDKHVLPGAGLVTEAAQSLGVKSVKVGLGAAFTVVGASVVAHVTKNVHKKQEAGEKATLSDRLQQGAALAVTIASLAYTVASAKAPSGRGV